MLDGRVKTLHPKNMHEFYNEQNKKHKMRCLANFPK